MSNEPTGQGAAGRAPPRPGPDALYGDTPTPPQLENGFGWSADPLLIAGSGAYVDGEYLYQDFVYDDHGADTRSWVSGSPTNASSPGGVLSQPTGDYHYPNDPDRYGYNAADLLEFRARPTDEGVAYRVTLNTTLEPDAAAVAIGIDTAADRRTDWATASANSAPPSTTASSPGAPAPNSTAPNSTTTASPSTAAATRSNSRSPSTPAPTPGATTSPSASGTATPGSRRSRANPTRTSPAARRTAATPRRCSTSASDRRTRSRWSATST